MVYEFNRGDLQGLGMLLNIILIMRFGLVASWFGLAIVLVSLALDFFKYKPFVNVYATHIMSCVLNIYFLILFY